MIMKKFVKENINEWEGPENEGMSRSFKRNNYFKWKKEFN
jgi:hypothetical protein